jgi:hypothetical protein
MSICAKDFLSKKVSQNIWPIMKNRILSYSTLIENKEDDKNIKSKTNYYNEKV